MSVVLFTHTENLLCSVHFSKHFPHSFDAILVLWSNYPYPQFIYEETEARGKWNTLTWLQLKPEGTDDVAERSLEIKQWGIFNLSLVKTHRWMVVMNRTHFFCRFRFLLSHFKWYLNHRSNAFVCVGSFSTSFSLTQESMSECKQEMLLWEWPWFHSIYFFPFIFYRCKLVIFISKRTLTQADLRKR